MKGNIFCVCLLCGKDCESNVQHSKPNQSQHINTKVITNQMIDKSCIYVSFDLFNRWVMCVGVVNIDWRVPFGQ